MPVELKCWLYFCKEMLFEKLQNTKQTPAMYRQKKILNIKGLVHCFFGQRFETSQS